MKKGKGCNLAAGILDIIIAAYFIVLGLLGILVLGTFGAALDELDGASGFLANLGLIFGIIFMGLAAIYLAFGIITIKITNKPALEYYNKKGALLAFSIVETIMLALIIYYLVQSFEVTQIILVVVYVIVLILHWTGFGLLASGEKQFLASGGGDIPTHTAPAQPEISQAKPALQEDKLEKLAKLNELKKSGAITEEEFNQMKSKILTE